MNPLQSFIAWFMAKRRARIAAREEHRRAVIIQQIADRRRHHREFKPLYGDLKRATHAALAAEVGASDPAALAGRG